jgi:hypothetical protein
MEKKRLFCQMNKALVRCTEPKQWGQSSVEFLFLGSLICIALALGKPSILEQLISALQSAYQSFSMAMSMP